MTSLLELDGITKSFPGVLANDSISFSVDAGEIHALLGENGAGKSTLVKMLYGLLRPDSGTMRMNGATYAPTTPAVARESGVGMVFQHFNLFEAMSVAENIALSIPGGKVDAPLVARIQSVSAAYRLPIHPDRMIGDLSVGERQRVEVVRALMQSPRLLIMDEPTSVLTPQEADDLFETLRALAQDGISVLYISHRLAEIKSLCHRATILRGGKIVASCDPSQESARSLAEMMIGAKLAAPTTSNAELGRVRLRVEALSTAPVGTFGIGLKDVCFDVRAGEIFGIGGVAGNGQTELMEALIGEVTVPPDAIRLDEDPVGDLDARKRRAKSMSFAPEERLGHAMSPNMSLTENVFLSARHIGTISKRGILNIASARRYAAEIVKAFDVRTTGLDQLARNLSGGNLQKYGIGREILQKPRVLIASQPTWGVDASAAAFVHRALIDLARDGSAVVVISQDLDELLSLSNRFAILSDGRLSAARQTAAASVEEIGLLMGGKETMENEVLHAAS